MGILIAMVILFTWLFHLIYLLTLGEVAIVSPWLPVHILVQAYLYTGLFITAHDAMHGLVSQNRMVNNGVGRLAAWLFAAFSYSRLLKKHQLHHRYPGEAGDPDYCISSQNFWVWWFLFLKNYVGWWQIITMAVLFNILQIWVDQLNLIFFWVLPSILATFQLFYFGTYLPHRLPHTETMLPHNARTQPDSNWRAMLSCYFFGYHYEHHEWPHIPWWKLYQTKKMLK